MFAMTLSYFRPDARRLEDLLAGGIDADVDGVEPGLDHAARDRFGDQRSVADHADFLDALLLRVADLLDQLLVDERLAVVVHPDVGDAELARTRRRSCGRASTLMIPCLRCMSSRGQKTHFALQMFVLSICTISGMMRRAIAPRREQQPADRLRLLAQQRLRRHAAHGT